MSNQAADSASRNVPSADPVRLYRTVGIIAAALERRRRKIAAGVPVDPPPECGCARCEADLPRAAP